MRRGMRIGGLAVGLLAAAAGAARGQAVHEIRMEADGGEYRFAPATVTARPGDVLVFKAVSGAPHSVVFEEGGLTPRIREALNEAMPRRSGDLSSPLLTENRAEYRMTVPAIPGGSYRFFCLPHRAYDMRGELVIK